MTIPTIGSACHVGKGKKVWFVVDRDDERELITLRTDLNALYAGQITMTLDDAARRLRPVKDVPNGP